MRRYSCVRQPECFIPLSAVLFLPAKAPLYYFSHDLTNQLQAFPKYFQMTS